MVSFPALVARQLAGAAFAALLTLGHSAAHAQLAPSPAPAPARSGLPQDVAYFVDGKVATQLEVGQLSPGDIQSINIVKGAQTQQLGLAAEQKRAMLITTKAGASSPEVAAFNQRFPTTPATPAQTAAVAAAQAYLKQHYPAAKLESVFPVKDRADRYTAVFEEKGRRLQLLFDGQGQLVAQ